jgi:hypothetical protein
VTARLTLADSSGRTLAATHSRGKPAGCGALGTARSPTSVAGLGALGEVRSSAFARNRSRNELLPQLHGFEGLLLGEADAIPDDATALELGDLPEVLVYAEPTPCAAGSYI